MLTGTIFTLVVSIGQHIVDVLYANHFTTSRRVRLQSFTFAGSSNQYSFSRGTSSNSTTDLSHSSLMVQLL